MAEKRDVVTMRVKRPGMCETLNFVMKNTIMIAQAIYDKKEVRLYIGADNDFHAIASPLTELEFRR